MHAHISISVWLCECSSGNFTIVFVSKNGKYIAEIERSINAYKIKKKKSLSNGSTSLDDRMWISAWTWTEKRNEKRFT